MATRIQVVIDCADPDGLATFWAEVLGYKKQDPPKGYATWRDFETAQGVPQDELNSWHAVVDPDGAGPRVYFHRVPEPKRGKNRLHLDLAVARDVPPEEYRRRIGYARSGRPSCVPSRNTASTGSPCWTPKGTSSI